MTRHWTLEDISWNRFDRSKVDPELLKAVKAASLVEYNAGDYVDYLKKVFHDRPEIFPVFDQWGREEVQHGLALGRWAEIADPHFDFETAFAKFREGYRPAHFDTGEAQRGGRAGEMIARCVVESGTSSYYSAMKDASSEPVLKEIAAHIAADEFAHYRLFYETLAAQDDEKLTLWQRLYVAVTRVNEAEDDELAYAYYCANTPADQIGRAPYDRKACAQAYSARVSRMYRERHLYKAFQMIAKAAGLHPKGWLPRIASKLVWNYFRFQAWRAPAI